MGESEWKPGDVVVLRPDSEPYAHNAVAAFMEELVAWWPKRPKGEVGVRGGTAILGWLAKAFRDAQDGPLVVIDPADREQVGQLRDALDPSQQMFLLSDYQRALREFASPKPDEPTGLGAVVEDAAGERWVRTSPTVADFHWNHESGDRTRPWRTLDAVRVLSEGVQP